MKWLELKIIPPLVTIIIGLLMWAVAQFTPKFSILAKYNIILAIVFVILGLLLMFISAYFMFKRKTTINPMKPQNASSLVTSGLFALSRNPIYVADAIILLGWGLFLANLFSIALIILFVLYMNKFQIIPEEHNLEQLFGDEYLAYKAKVRRWI